LQDLIARVRAGELHGLNVTIPHKENVVGFMDELTPTALAIGAVNTIYLCDKKLIGDNTDAAGFLSDLNRFLTINQSSIVNRKSAIILGAGGSARAVVYALLNDGWQVTLAARRIEQAQHLAHSFSNYQFQVANFSSFILQPLSLLVNTTPLGMSPNIEQSPLPENIPLPKETIVYDLVYNPRETKLIRDARAQGCFVTTGLGMLIEQAALAFELWTGHNPPRDVLWNAAEN
jgi:shikimate dehydrogenase